jgi:hypothetical protein
LRVVDDVQRTLLGTFGLALMTAFAVTWVIFGPGALVSGERIAPAAVSFIVGGWLFIVALRSRTGGPDQPSPSTVVTSYGQKGGVTAGEVNIRG